MKFTDLFIRRPVLALVINLMIIIAGLQAIRSVNVRQFPRNENSSVTVKTVYVGANAELVRGFITTPLERAIASADGIDYMQSQSSQGLSSITVRLKLNYDPLKALAEVSSKVDQVRQDLPPESEVPIIDVVSADSQFAAAYLSFESDILDQNQITDYLIRMVQPRLSAIEGMQRANPRRPDICHAHLAAARAHGSLQYQPAAGPAGSGRQQLSCRRRPDKRRAYSGEPDGQYRSAYGRGV